MSRPGELIHGFQPQPAAEETARAPRTPSKSKHRGMARPSGPGEHPRTANRKVSARTSVTLQDLYVLSNVVRRFQEEALDQLHQHGQTDLLVKRWLTAMEAFTEAEQLHVDEVVAGLRASGFDTAPRARSARTPANRSS